MGMITVNYKGKEYQAEQGKRAIEILKEAETETSAFLVASINGKFIDLGTPLNEGGELKAFTFEDAEGKQAFWHSTSHIMAAAVKRLYPDTKVTIGPSIDEGFYYDFDREKNFGDDDLVKIEEEMMKVIKENAGFSRQEISKKDAIKMFSDMGETYKIEIMEGINDDTVSTYTTAGFTDLCRGPHIGLAKKIKAVKLLKLAGAYWRGDEKNKMLQRIYGISFPSKEMLEQYLHTVEEAKQRDHRKLGKELDLFSTHEEFGPGLIYWHPKGGVIRKEMEDFWRNEHIKNGYDLIFSPHIAKIDLWNTSGHTGFYRDSMFDTMNIDKMEYQLKPMNCPFHILMYNNGKKSYRDLPLRWAELGTVYRYEKSGVLHGLMRVRGFTQDDAHIFCREDQLESEIIEALNFVMFILRTFGFSEFEVYLSTMPADHIGDDSVWVKAQDALKSALSIAGLKYGTDEGGGAFYGPKIDIKIKDALNRTWQCSTIQVDFNLPERFNINYTGKDGKEHRAIMIHRALMGSLERFFGVLIEHYKGAFPVWLAPKQVMILTITERCDDYAKELAAELKKNNIRVGLDLDSEKIGAKIRKATMDKVPYMLILGDKEVESRTVSVRKRTGEEEKGVDFIKFIEMVTAKIKNKELGI
ncbi:MAG: threonine--tRNA ligase [Candidatus Goldiibacteriota bacterium HGW-Goldbacteria-1]|jgi:threonyl-tRNA synthetase|nr:MAG: threonine--tRNA ligase [Candidatus Goldiibacteriota bacterium HGW-Goldbacteria-1]